MERTITYAGDPNIGVFSRVLGDIVTELTGDATFRERRGAVGLLTRGLLTRENAHE